MEPNIFTILSAIAALASAVFALLSYSSERKIRDDLKADERIIFGKPHHPPQVPFKGHSDACLAIPIHNVSTNKRVFITKVVGYDSKGNTLDFAWAGSIDKTGNVEDSGEVLKVAESETLFLRVRDGESIHYMNIKIFHTFSETAQVIIFDEFADL